MLKYNPTMQFIKPYALVPIHDDSTPDTDLLPKGALLDIEVLQHNTSFKFEPWEPVKDQMLTTKERRFSSMFSIPFWLMVGALGYVLFRR